jgi:probable HAF family extracellular repeat protein
MAPTKRGRHERPLALERLEDRCLLSYSITDLDTLGGLSSAAFGLNDTGHVAGYAEIAGANTPHAFRGHTDTTPEDLGTLGGAHSYGYGINPVGKVVGAAETAGGALHAFAYHNGQMADLGTLGGDQSSAYGMNLGQVVGEADTIPGTHSPHAFLWENSTLTDLGTLGGKESHAYGINASGQVVGQADVAAGIAHAFLWQDGALTDLGTLGGSFSTATGINDLGQVVGYSKVAGARGFHAFLDRDGTMTDLGTLGGMTSAAYSINAAGQAVGSSTSRSGSEHAFLYQDGTLTDLNEVLSNGADWTLISAQAINDFGQIAGYGTNPAGQTHAYLLTPDDPSVAQVPPRLDLPATEGIASPPPASIAWENPLAVTDALTERVQRVTAEPGFKPMVQPEASMPLASTGARQHATDAAVLAPGFRQPGELTDWLGDRLAGPLA